MLCFGASNDPNPISFVLQVYVACKLGVEWIGYTMLCFGASNDPNPNLTLYHFYYRTTGMLLVS